jgi:ribonuclease BN (tRNA processing enzyme)
MNATFCVLGSGSKGNASLLATPHLRLLLDAGFAPDELAERMAGAGASWKTLDAVLLTHTHSDHIRKRCLALFAEHGIQFFCHKRHTAYFAGGRYFNKLRDKGLVRVFDSEPFLIRPKGIVAQDRSRSERGLSPVTRASSLHAHAGKMPAPQSPCLRVQPIPLPHDSPPTLGFRIEAMIAGPDRSRSEPLAARAILRGAGGLRREAPAAVQTERWAKLAYLADLGEFHAEMARAVAGVDLLALEFNHDEEMERNSGRPAYLIERVLSKDGHLSNNQAAEAFRLVLAQGPAGGPKTLVQLHLSQECNTPLLAFQAAQEVITACGARTEVYSTRQDQRGKVHVV